MTGVVPMEDGAILTAASADARGHRGLAAWLRDAEVKWNEHSNKDVGGNARMSLAERVDAMGMLRAKPLRASVRVLYTKAGTRLSACWLEDDDVVIDHKAYWSAASSLEEAAYIAAVLNTSVVLDRVSDLQPVGQRDPRDFDNLIWTLRSPNTTRARHCTGTSLRRRYTQPPSPRALNCPAPRISPPSGD